MRCAVGLFDFVPRYERLTKKSIRFLVLGPARVASSDPRVGIFILFIYLLYLFINFVAMKRCPIAAKIAGSIGIVSFKRHMGMKVCPIGAASLSQV